MNIRLLSELEKHLARLGYTTYDKGLSLTILPELLPLLPPEGSMPWEESLSAFVEERYVDLKRVLDTKQDAVRYPLLLQPEAILIFYLLSCDPFVSERWPSCLSEDDLRKFSILWGIAYSP